MKRIALLCPLLLFILTSGALAQVQVGDSGTFQGLTFGDFYWVPSNHNANLEGSSGFWIRRIYLTYDHTLSDSFSGRVRLEMNSNGDLMSGGDMTPEVKDAYLKWSRDRHELFAGISSSPTFGLTEDIWGYRSVEKSPLDLQRMASSRDFGIALKGSLDSEEKLGYHFMFGNGNGTSSETNKGKKVMLSLSYELTDQWIAEVYGDYNGETADQRTYTFQGLLGYQSDAMNAGFLYARQYRDRMPVGENRELDIASVFTHFGIRDNATAIFRIDHMFDPNPGGEDIDYIPFSSRAESTLLIGGVDLELNSNVHLMPNIEAVLYGETAVGDVPDPDLIPRLTLEYTF